MLKNILNKILFILGIFSINVCSELDSCQCSIQKVKDFFKTLDRDILAKTEEVGYFPTWEMTGTSFWSHYWIAQNFLLNEQSYSTECIESKGVYTLKIKMEFDAVLNTKFEIVGSSLFRTRKYIAKRINDIKNSFVTVELTKNINSDTNEETFNANFFIDYRTAEIDDCIQEKFVAFNDNFETCEFASKFRMKLFFKLHADEENMKKMAIEYYQKQWKKFNGQKSPALSKISFLG